MRILLIVMAVGLTQEAPSGAAKAEIDRHQGVWAVESFVSDGRETPADIARSITRTVDGDHVVWKRDGKSFAGTTVVLDATATPHAIDVIPDGGRGREKRVLGIYKLEGERLTICMAGPDEPRPKSFDGGKGTGQTLMTFRREPKGAPSK